MNFVDPFFFLFVDFLTHPNRSTLRHQRTYDDYDENVEKDPLNRMDKYLYPTHSPPYRITHENKDNGPHWTMAIY